MPDDPPSSETPPAQTPRKPRKPWIYTPARQRSLRKAILARQLRECEYPITPARLEAWRRNSLLAAKVIRERGRYVRHGTYTPSLRVSLGHAGETLAEFDAHLQLFDRLFDVRNAPPPGAADWNWKVWAKAGRVPLLARAVAEVVWRRRRGFRGQYRWECRQLERLLVRAGVRPPRNLSEAVEFAHRVNIVLTDDLTLNERMRRLLGRLQHLLNALMKEKYGRPLGVRCFPTNTQRPPDLNGSTPSMLGNPLLSAQYFLQVRCLRPPPPGDVRFIPSDAAREQVVTRTPADLERALRAIFTLPKRGQQPQADKVLRRLVMSLWRRLEAYRRRAEFEMREIQELTQTLDLQAPLGAEDAQAAAKDLMDAFEVPHGLFVGVTRHDRRIKKGLKDLIALRFGAPPGWRLFRSEDEVEMEREQLLDWRRLMRGEGNS